MAYLLDSNTFIQAKNFFYRFSFCPGFWDWLSIEHSNGNLFSIEKVRDELTAGNDDLALWATTTIARSFFLKPTPSVVTTQSVVARWVNSQSVYSQPNIYSFLSKADPWLIAQAMEGNFEIVTFETLVPPNSTVVKIPNVAVNFQVQTISIYDVMDRIGAVLRL